jgi:hypothetical protein
MPAAALPQVQSAPLPKVDLGALPSTLKEWRSAGHNKDGLTNRAVWRHLEPFFEALGYKLWKSQGMFILVPPNKSERSPDGFTFRTHYSEEIATPYFDLAVSLMEPFGWLSNNDFVLERNSLPREKRKQPGFSHSANFQRRGRQKPPADSAKNCVQPHCHARRKPRPSCAQGTRAGRYGFCRFSFVAFCQKSRVSLPVARTIGRSYPNSRGTPRSLKALHALIPPPHQGIAFLHDNLVAHLVRTFFCFTITQILTTFTGHRHGQLFDQLRRPHKL